MKNFSQTFVNYHGCGNGYLDGTKKIVPEDRKWIMPKYNPFWKNPIHTSNKIAKSTRSQIKKKTKAKRNYIRRYAKYAKIFHEKNGILTMFFGVLTIAQTILIITHTMNQTATLQ